MNIFNPICVLRIKKMSQKLCEHYANDFKYFCELVTENVRDLVVEQNNKTVLFFAWHKGVDIVDQLKNQSQYRTNWSNHESEILKMVYRVGIW